MIIIEFAKIKFKKALIWIGIIVVVILTVLSVIKISNHNDKHLVMSELTGKIWRNIDYKDYEERYIFYEDFTYIEGDFLNQDYYNATSNKNGKFKIKEDLFGNLKIILVPEGEKYYRPEGYIEFNNNTISKIKISYYYFAKMTETQLEEEKELQLAEEKKKAEETAEKEKIKVIDVTCNSSGSGSSYFTIVSGKIHNISEKKYNKVTVNISMYDLSGKYIGNTTKTVSGNIFAGGTIEFLRTTQTASKITKVVVTVREVS